MRKAYIVNSISLVTALFWLLPAAAGAQNIGLSGRVTDETGAVLPGVTVEARSPALIEQVRAVVTDGEGLFAITALRPGAYVVTFQLPGFTTVVRDGIVLSGAVIATVNVEMTVGSLDETITVTGAAPEVDIRNVVRETTLTTDVRNALPLARNLLQMSEIVPGMRMSVSGGTADVGGTELNRGNSTIHGSKGQDYTMEFDGTQNTRGGSGTQAVRNVDPGEVQEFVYETGALSAETSTGGVRARLIPKEGGNVFSGAFFTTYAGSSGDNTDQDLIDAGLRQSGELLQIRDFNVSVGGPVIRDKLWFFASTRLEGAEKTIPGSFKMIDPLAFLYNPRLGAAGNADLSAETVDDLNHQMYSTRFTWQANRINKFNFYVSNHSWNQAGLLGGSSRSLEAAHESDVPWGRMNQVKWTAAVTNRLLFEATIAEGYNSSKINDTQDGALQGSDIVGVYDLGTGTFFRAGTLLGYGTIRSVQNGAKFSVSYVTGSHAAKFGGNVDWGDEGWNGLSFNRGEQWLQVNGSPIRINVRNHPQTNRGAFQKIGLFAQDQWTIDRLTVNAGVRYDAHVGSIPEDKNFTGPNRFAPLIDWPALDNVPNWKDISPRFGVAFDLFGDARTALKFSASRYIVGEGVGFADSVNPLEFNGRASAPWSDANGDHVPDPGEVGPLSNPNFATAATNVAADDAIREGWGVRQYNWEFSTGVQHQLMDGLSVDIAYVSRFYRNFFVTDLVDVLPEHYSEYCVTAPTDGRLGTVSGTEICGLFDINPAQRTLPATLRTGDGNFGTQKESWQGMDFTGSFNRGRVIASGGMSIGVATSKTDDCFVVDSPQQMYQCAVTPPWSPSFAGLVSVGLPYGIDAAVTYRGRPGPEILANLTYRNSNFAAGTVRFLDPARTSFSGGSATVSLLQPGTDYGERYHNVDLRLSWGTELFGAARAKVTLDIANLLNGNYVLSQSNTYGGNWLRPNEVLLGRIIKPGLLINW